MKRKVLLAGAAAFVALFLFSGCMLFREYSDAKHSEETFDRVSSLIVSDPVNTDALPPDSEAGQRDPDGRLGGAARDQPGCVRLDHRAGDEYRLPRHAEC